jgi:hypothetical protein
MLHWTKHPGSWYHDLWSTTVRIRVTGRLRISTSPLFALFTCCWWMSFEAVLGYLCMFCELFCGHSSSSQEFVTVGINLGTVWLLFYYWTSKLINVLLFPSFPNSHNLRANIPKYRDPDPRYKHCHIAIGIFVNFALNWTPRHLVPWPLEQNCPNQSDSQIANINITTICTIYMLVRINMINWYIY